MRSSPVVSLPFDFTVKVAEVSPSAIVTVLGYSMAASWLLLRFTSSRLLLSVFLLMVRVISPPSFNREEDALRLSAGPSLS